MFTFRNLSAVLGLSGLLLLANVDPLADEEVEIFPIGRYVIMKKDRFWRYREFAEEIVDGTATYDDIFKHPYLPLNRILVDCKDVHRIGVTLGVEPVPTGVPFGSRRPPDIYSKRIRVSYEWSHSAIAAKGGRYEWFAYTGDYRPTLGLINGALELTKKDRVDGELKIEIKRDDEIVYKTSFELVGCANDA